MARDDYPITCHGASLGQASAPRTRPRPWAGSRQPNSYSPNSNRNMSGPRPGPRGTKHPKSTAQGTQRPPTGRARLGHQLDGIFHGNHRRSKFKPARHSHPATIWNSILCGLELAINTNITKPHKRTPNFCNPSLLPSVASPIPHPCALLLHLHVSPLR